MSANKMMQYTTKSGKVRVRTIPNGNETSDLYNVLKNAVNVYTPIVKGLLHPQLVAERPAGDLERVWTFRKQQKTRFNDESDKTRGVMVKEDIGRGEWILEMTGEIYLESQVKDRSIMERENSHYLYKDIRLGAGNEPICMAVWKQETVGRYIRRSCQPTCRLVHLYGTELHLMVEALQPMKSGEEVTLPLEADCQGFKDQLKCLHHQANAEDCPLEKERLLSKAQRGNPVREFLLVVLNCFFLLQAAYSTVVTLTDSDEEIEITVPRKPESVESAGPSSSDASARPSPEAPKAPAVLRDSEIQGTSNRENANRRENEENRPVAPQVLMSAPNPVAQAEIDEPVENDDVPVVDAPRDARSLRAVNDVVSSLSTRRSNNAEPETAPETMDVPEPMDAPEAAAQEPEEAAAPVDVDDIPAIAIDPPTRRRLRFAGIEQEALDLTEAAEEAAARVDAPPASPTRMRHRARLQVSIYALMVKNYVWLSATICDGKRLTSTMMLKQKVLKFERKVLVLKVSELQNTDPATAPESMGAPEAAAYEPEEAPALVDEATLAPPTRRRLRSAGNGRAAALDLTEPKQVAVSVIVAGLSTRMQHRTSKKSAGAPCRRARVQVNIYAVMVSRNSRSVNSAAVMSPRTDRAHPTRSSARSVAAVPPTIHNAPVVAPPAGRKNRRAQLKALAANARRCHREQNEALAATNVDPATGPPGAPAASVVVDHPTTRRSHASQVCSPVDSVSTRRPAASRPTPVTSRPAAPRQSAPAPSAPPAVPAPRARKVSVARQDAITLIGQSMHPTRAAVKQLRDKNPNEDQAGQGSTPGAPAVKKPRKTAVQQVKRGRGGKK
ncbi:hypothetical protein CRE_03488 [Caenorhabditis remanei]|uniref:SET domain-containing protein n=1 Tax=Caenorhabditis remanei TaxID=31234 RepID=E3NIA1_CAERE|nr:hypothetical protein CRE_03488 [Caenorhabditis remanei]